MAKKNYKRKHLIMGLLIVSEAEEAELITIIIGRRQ